MRGEIVNTLSIKNKMDTVLDVVNARLVGASIDADRHCGWPDLALGPKVPVTGVMTKVVEVELSVSGTRKYLSSIAHTLLPAIPPGPRTTGPLLTSSRKD